MAAAWESFADRSALERLALIAAAWHLRDEETCHLARSFREKGGGDGNTAAGAWSGGGSGQTYLEVCKHVLPIHIAINVRLKHTAIDLDIETMIDMNIDTDIATNVRARGRRPPERFSPAGCCTGARVVAIRGSTCCNKLQAAVPATWSSLPREQASFK